MRSLVAMMRKEFLHIARDPQLIGFVIGLPILLLVLFGYALRLRPDNLTVAVWDQEPGLFSVTVKDRLADIERVVIETQEPGVRIIDKTGPLANPADRDHCIQYMVAVPLLLGRLTAADYEDEVAADPRIDALRAKMQVRENPTFTAEYYAADKRYIGNAVQVFFRDGSASERVQVDYPVGHRKRRAEGMPLLVRKFETSVAAHYDAAQSRAILGLCRDGGRLDALPVQEFVTALVKQ